MSDNPGRLAGRTALVTGASRGIGAGVARRFAAEGAQVILIARTRGGLEEVDDAIRDSGGSATLIVQDLTQYDQVDQLGPALLDRFGSLDIFVGAAATLGVLTPLGHLSPETWQHVFDLNVTANWRLMRTLEPLLRRSPAGRAILVTCSIAREPTAFWGPYAASKAALESLARTWAAENRRTELKINLLDPGPVATALRATAFPGEDPSALPTPDDAAEAFVDLAAADCARNADLVQSSSNASL